MKYPNFGEMREQGTTALMPEWLSTKEAAEYLRVSVDVIYDAIQNLGLKHTRVGGRRVIRFRREWLDSWMESFARVSNQTGSTDWKPV